MGSPGSRCYPARCCGCRDGALSLEKAQVMAGFAGSVFVVGRVMAAASGSSASSPQSRPLPSSTLHLSVFTLCGHDSAYGHRVSGVMDNRAAAFTHQPQVVEVYQAGAWWAGELLGWRHDVAGNCRVQVRVVLGGVAETTWTDLATLRLPERHLSIVAPTVSAARDVSPAHPAGSRRRHRVSSDAPAVTASLPAFRDMSVGPLAGPPPRPGGRRRAPEEGAPALPATRSGAAGRHRAPAALTEEDGRHRAAETGFLPVVVQGAPVQVGPVPTASPQARTPRPEGSSTGRPQVRSAGADTEPNLLTRPMRLSDLTPPSRHPPRLDGSLRSS